jgi:two-component system, OmpR family, phosphate regulon sensor histidine kinase PhoR
MPAKFAYPWFFFYRMARLTFLVYLVIILSALYFSRQTIAHTLSKNNSLTAQEQKSELNQESQQLILKIVPISFGMYLVLLYMFYLANKPLGVILAKLQKYQDEIPFEKTLRMLYKKDEWAQIREALNKADKKLQDQVALIKVENEKIGAILESIHDDIIAIDNFETVLFYNTNFKRDFIKLKSSGELMPKIWHTFEDEAVLKAFREVLKTGQTTQLKSNNFKMSSHPERFFDLTISPLKAEDGKISGALGVFYDVTEFKLTEQMRVDFVANVSHEIRTPLTSIKGYTQILQTQKQNLEPEYQLFLEKIIINTERMITLFNDLLNLSVIESKETLRIEKLPIRELLDSVAQNIKTIYSNKKININLDLDLEFINGDQRLMEQVFSNLLDNACKYSGREASIRIFSIEQQGKALISISDNGPGISREHLNRIFERFYRIESSRESMRGTGLGLSIVKHIISKHGGRIWAESEGHQGSSFLIELPLEKIL